MSHKLNMFESKYSGINNLTVKSTPQLLQDGVGAANL